MNPQTLHLGPYGARVQERLRAWGEARFAERLWQRDPTLWSAKPVPEIADRLGWLTLPEASRAILDDLHAFANEIRDEGARHVVLLGMGGSSLAPEVFQRTFGSAPGHLELVVLDSTHPDAVRALESQVEMETTLFLVSSKSGTTTETLSLLRYFWRRTAEATVNPEGHFVAITDPGTPLELLAAERAFRRTFLAPADVGGRYSALTAFGLVPAALIGVDLPRLLDEARTMAAACSAEAPEENPGLVLGAALGELALPGRDKLTFLASPALAAFPTWLEQLIAESTGKKGRGIVAVVDEGIAAPGAYGSDRVFVLLHLEGDGDEKIAELAALVAAGHPAIEIRLTERAGLGQELFRWQVAVAASGAVLGIHPFDQPDVQLAKDLATRAMTASRQGDTRFEDDPEPIRVDDRSLAEALRTWLTQAQRSDYVALQAYLAPTPQTTAALQRLRLTLRDRLRVATTAGYGPRFLHSTGQLHKGGPNAGLFLQLVDEPAKELPVPETGYTFNALIRAQASGDALALRQRGRRLLRVDLGRDAVGGLAALTALVMT